MSSIWARMRRTVKGLMLYRMPGMITCREFEDFMADYVDGSLPAGQRRVFELHLKICRECREYLAAYRRTIEVSARAFEDQTALVPPEVPEDLVQAIIDARRS
ncbi:MAG: anti-sigma factor family protein [Hyphomicrobiales bacterium]